MSVLIGLRTETDSLRNLDFLRFVASAGIVFYHSNEFFFSPSLRSAVIAKEGFALYVDLFFMVSGFVLAFVYLDRMTSLASYLDFLWRRIARLYPLHLVVLILNVAVWAVLLTRGESATAPSFKPSCVLQTALLVQEYFNCGSPYSFNGVTWSISVEMGLYVLFPLFSLLAMRGPLWIGGLSLILAAVAVHLLSAYGEWGHLPHIMRGLVGFPAGVFIFRIRHHLPNLHDKGGSVILLSALVIIEMLMPTPNWITMLSLFTLFVVSVASDTHGNVSRMVGTLAPLGQMTYSMYIWHRVFILLFMNVVADKLMPGNLPIVVTMTLLCYATIFGVSYAGYFLIERPARRALNKLPKKLLAGLQGRVR